MSNYTYMVTNNKNGKVYVGSHSWKGEGLDPNYYGSGKIIKQAVEKYGKENFQVEVLYYYDTVEECRADEERILTEYNVRDCIHSYNIKNAAVGMTSEDMTGEKHPLYGKHHTDETRQKMSQAHKGKTLSADTKRKMSEAQKGKRGKDSPRYGKHHTDATRKKMSQAHNYKKIPIVAIQLSTGKIRVFESKMECARKLNLDPAHIRHCLRGRCKTHKGYTFKYAEQPESVPPKILQLV